MKNAKRYEVKELKNTFKAKAEINGENSAVTITKKKVERNGKGAPVALFTYEKVSPYACDEGKIITCYTWEMADGSNLI